MKSKNFEWWQWIVIGSETYLILASVVLFNWQSRGLERESVLTCVLWGIIISSVVVLGAGLGFLLARAWKWGCATLAFIVFWFSWFVFIGLPRVVDAIGY